MPGSLVLVSIASCVTYLVGSAIYSLILHPLSSYPGPKLSAVSRIPWWINCITGDQVRFIHKLHSQYGPVVRFAPDELSYADDGQSWKEVHGRERGRDENPKVTSFQLEPMNGVPNILSANDVDHPRVRRLFAPAFSDRALKSQEDLFRKHADLMVFKLREAGAGGRPTEMVSMFNCTTFDIMGDLTFGQPLGLLENTELSPWVKSVFDSVRILPLIQLIQYYPLLNAIFHHIEPKFVTDMKREHFRHSADRVDKRLAEGSEKPDIWNLVLSAKDGAGLSLAEMHSNSELFMLGGSETTATFLSGVTYLLLTNPENMKLLVDEIRGSFSDDREITMERLAGLKYLQACISEGMRCYPPVPIGTPRSIAAGGQVVLGKYLPPWTRVSVHHYSMYHSPANFRDPESFAPERWLGDPRYRNDRRECVNPFAVGPRSCLGKNMAYHEIRLLLALLLFNFDLELCEGMVGWMDQRVFALWEKKPLFCRLRAVV